MASKSWAAYKYFVNTLSVCGIFIVLSESDLLKDKVCDNFKNRIKNIGVSMTLGIIKSRLNFFSRLPCDLPS